ncbi:hypothetical protein ACFX1R_006039 [Malus domestica]
MTKKADDGAGDDIDQSDGWDRVIEVSAPAMTLINPLVSEKLGRSKDKDPVGPGWGPFCLGMETWRDPSGTDRFQLGHTVSNRLS